MTDGPIDLGRYREWGEVVEIKASDLEPADFDGFGLPEEDVRRLFADRTAEGNVRLTRVHGLGAALAPLMEHSFSLPPEHTYLFETGDPLNIPLRTTGQSVMEAAFESSEALRRAELAMADIANDIGSWIGA